MAVLAVVLAVVAVAAVVAVVALVKANGRVAELTTTLDATRAEAAEHERARDAARAEADAARDDVARADALARSLWSLELLRVAREWAVTGGDVPAPVTADTGAELVTALRMELDRQREESGIPGELDAAAAPGDVPVATAFAGLRVVEEVLATVSRPSEGLTVSARDDDGELVVTITLDEADADVPALVRDIAAGAGATIVTDGSTVVVRVRA